MYPSEFLIPMAPPGGVNTLVIDSASTAYITLDSDRDPFPVEQSPAIIAQSIVEDYIKSNLGVTEEAFPGLFWEYGAFTPDRAEKELGKQIEQARKHQDNWFNRLVAMADDDWNRNHQRKTIADIQRFAAKALNLTRDWNLDVSTENQCPFCRSNISPLAAVCPICTNVVNPELFEKIQTSKPTGRMTKIGMGPVTPTKPESTVTK